MLLVGRYHSKYFLPLVQTVGFLAQDGILRVIHIHSCKQLYQVGSQDLVTIVMITEMVNIHCHIVRASLVLLLLSTVGILKNRE